MTEDFKKEGRIIVDGVNVISCKYFLFRDEPSANERTCGMGLTACKGKNCDFKEIANLKRENKEKIDIIEQMIKILYPNANDDELYDVTFNGEYIDKLKELKDTADTMLMANDIKKQDINSLREANERLEQENKELSFAIEKYLENAGIECDDEEQALRSLPMLGNAHYKVLVEKEELKQENKRLKEKLNAFVEHSKTESDKVYYKMLDYKSALEEIREYCNSEHGSVYVIIDKINEVLE